MSHSTTRTVLQIVSMNNEGDSAYRMRWPAEHLAQQRPDWRVINLDAQAAERFEWGLEADLLVLYQQSDPDMLRLIRQRKERGLNTIVEYNDNYYAPPAGSPAAKAWRSPLLWHAYERVMQAGDAVVVTGPGLRELLGEYAQNINIIPNYLPQMPPEFHVRRASGSDEIRLGWAGSIGHVADILSVKRVIQGVLRDYPNVTFCLMGNVSLPGELGLPQNRVQFTPWGDMAAYYNFLDGIDIGLAPLLDTAYNRCRSDVKALELAAHSVKPILPDRLPYQEFIAETGSESYRTLRELDALLRKNIENAELRESAARRCHDYVCAHRVGVNNHIRAELYAQHMPQQAGEYDWGIAGGYHELMGAGKSNSRYYSLQRDLEKAYQAGSFSAIVEKWDAISEQFPEDPELCFLHLRTLSKRDPAAARRSLDKYLELFNKDIRFLLSAVILANSLEVKQQYWERILEILLAAPLHYADAFRGIILKNLQAYVNKYPNPEFAERFLDVYPDAAELRYQLWRMQEAAGNDAAAREHCAWLLNMYKMQQHAAEVVKKLNPEYLQAWQEGLDGRLE